MIDAADPQEMAYELWVRIGLANSSIHDLEIQARAAGLDEVAEKLLQAYNHANSACVELHVAAGLKSQ